MLKRVIVALLAAALLVGGTATAADASTPRPGALFNNPWGSPRAQTKLIRKIVSAVNSAHAGSTIRIASYSNDRVDVADALIAAHHRGVNVQVLLNDNWTSYQTRRLERRLGTDVSKPSFVRICYRSCRGRRGNLHSKFYLFSSTGGARYVTMVGSANLTGYGAKNQYNDLYTVLDNKSLFDIFSGTFTEMKRDRPMAQPFRSAVGRGGYTTNFYPRYDTTASDDPIMKRLNQIRCRGASGATGIGDRSLIRIAMYGWNGTRGRYLASKIASLSRHGCDIRVIESDAGGWVVRTLKASGVRVKSASYDLNYNGTVDRYTHQKYMLLSGRYAGRAAWHVWTGSQNWSDIALNGDEVTFHIPRRGAFWAYRRNFDHIWRYRSYYV